MQLEEKMAKSKREFGEGPIYTITNYIFWFFLGNLYFSTSQYSTTFHIN